MDYEDKQSADCKEQRKIEYENQQKIIHKTVETLKAVFLRKFNNEENPSLLEAPGFLVFGSEIYIDIRFCEKGENDEWNEYIKDVCQKNGCRIECCTKTCDGYHHTYVLA